MSSQNKIYNQEMTQTPKQIKQTQQQEIQNRSYQKIKLQNQEFSNLAALKATSSQLRDKQQQYLKDDIQSNDDLNNDMQTLLKQTLNDFIQSKYSKYVQIIIGIASLISCIFLTFDTYMHTGIQEEEVQIYLIRYNILEIILVCFYIINYAINIITSQNIFFFLLSFQSMQDIILIFSLIFLISDDKSLNNQTLSVSRLFRILKFTQMIKELFIVSNTELSRVEKQTYIIIISVLLIAYIFSSLILIFETPYYEQMIMQYQAEYQAYQENSSSPLPEFIPGCKICKLSHTSLFCHGDDCNCWLWGCRGLDSWRQVLHTISDPYCNHNYSESNKRAYQSDRHPITLRKKYLQIKPFDTAFGNMWAGVFQSDSQYVLRAFSFRSRPAEYKISHSQFIDSDFDYYLQNSQYEKNIIYLQGNVFQIQDIKRASIEQAKICIILSNLHQPESILKSDYSNIMTGILIKKHVKITQNRNMPILLQVFNPESRIHYLQSVKKSISSNDKIIVIEEIKMNLLAKSCFSPGIISMMGNLISSFSEEIDEIKTDQWLKEYINGMGAEIYRSKLSKFFTGKSFSQTASIIYEKMGAIIIAIEVIYDKQKIIRLNPWKYNINIQNDKCAYVYILCEDQTQADKVSVFNCFGDDQVNNSFQQENDQLSDSSQENYEENMDFDVNNTSEINLQDFEILQEPTNFLSVRPETIQGSKEIINNILVCGLHPNIYYFILTLRAKYLQEHQYIVILSQQQPSEQLWAQIRIFPKIIFIKGSPLEEVDLKRANIQSASKVVILGHNVKPKKKGNFDNNMRDAETIFIYQTIKKCYPNLQIITNLNNSENIEFLQQIQQEQNNDFKFEISPLYAAGEIYLSQFISTLTCQSYYNPHILTILQQFVQGTQSNKQIQNYCERENLYFFYSRIQSNLWQIYPPDDFLNKSFGELFQHLLLERHLLCIGVYRLPGVNDNLHPYVYTNPQKSTKLTHKDKIFVLGSQIPLDLISQNKNKINGFQQQGSNKLLQTNYTKVVFQKQKDLDMQNIQIQIHDTYQQSINENNELSNESDFQNRTFFTLVQLNINEQRILDQLYNYVSLLQKDVDQLEVQLNQFNDEITEKVQEKILQQIKYLAG